jgi:hypothetical protein
MVGVTIRGKGRLAAMIPVAGVLAASLFAAGSPAGASAATREVSALHITGRISLGPTSDVFANAFAQAPGGDVYYSNGSFVYKVTGNSAPTLAVTAGGTVLALAANTSELFVQVGLRVTAYRRSDESVIRHWTLTSPVTPITSAGLYAVGGTLWSWTDWATDGSGFEYAKVSRMSTSSSAVHTVNKAAYPGDMSADSAGLYFEAQHGSASVLGHATPSGTVTFHGPRPAEAPLALSGGRVDLLVVGTHDYVKSYSATSLSLISSKKVASSDVNIAGTGAGLLVLALPCVSASCVHAIVSKLNVSTGKTSGTLHVPGAALLLPGPGAAVIEVSGGIMYLVRVAA